jgi:hypothetical protein
MPAAGFQTGCYQPISDSDIHRRMCTEMRRQVDLVCQIIVSRGPRPMGIVSFSSCRSCSESLLYTSPRKAFWLAMSGDQYSFRAFAKYFGNRGGHVVCGTDSGYDNIELGSSLT